MRRHTILAILGAAALLACGDGASDAATADRPLLPGTPIAFGFLNPGQAGMPVDPHSAFLDPVRLVVRDPQALAAAWAEFYALSLAPPSVPTVDFSQYMVVVVSIGVTPGNRSMRVPLVTRLDDGTLAVAVEEHRLGSSCAYGPMETRPAAALLLPRSDRPVFFGEFLVIDECR